MSLVRALTRSVKLPDRVPQHANRMSASLGGLFSGSAQSGLQAYRDVGAAYGPIRRICESVALTNWSLYQQTETAGKVNRELIDDATAPARHPGTAIWTKPNPFMGRREFLFRNQLNLEGTGIAYWLLCQRGDSPYPPRGVQADFELWPILPTRIVPIPDPDEHIAGYLYTLGAEKIPLSVQSVVPLIIPDPLNPLGGWGPLQPIGAELEAERYAAQYQRNTFLNDAQPGGVIEFETPLTPDRFEELVLRWREQHQGTSNARRVAIIEGGTWKDTGQTNREMDYVKLRKHSREAAMFTAGMPFGMMLSEDVNLANAKVAEQVFYRWTLRPRLELVKELLNERVLPLIADNLTMDYELPAPEDESFDVFASNSGWLSGVLTRNEAREAQGYGVDPDWDGYITDMPSVAPAPLTMPPGKPPRKPTTLGYTREANEQRIRAMRESFDVYLATKKAT